MANKWRFGDVVEMLRGTTIGRESPNGFVVIAPEEDSWTHIMVAISSGVLDDMADYVVTRITTEKDYVCLQIATDEYNVPSKWDNKEESKNDSKRELQMTDESLENAISGLEQVRKVYFGIIDKNFDDEKTNKGCKKAELNQYFDTAIGAMEVMLVNNHWWP